jgi:hypothetical protein
MAPDLTRRFPGTAIPEGARDAAVRAGQRRRPFDPRVLRRVRDALQRLPDTPARKHDAQ